MKPLPRGFIAVACSLLVLARAQAIAPWPMAGGDYFEGFGTIATWANDFASPIEATRWGSVAVNGTGTIPDGRRTTVATSVFTTTTTGGVQRGSSNLVQLSTGATDNTSANAVDLYLDFTGCAPDTLAFDWSAVANGTGSRASSLRVYTTTNGLNFIELTNAAVLNLSNNVVASGSVTNIVLPAGFANCATMRIRFYEYNGTGGSSGQRAKIAIDNVSVTRIAPPTAITLPATGLSNTVATLNGTVNPGGATTTAWFEWGLSPFNYTNLTAPVAVGSGTNAVAVANLLSSLTPGLIYHGRLVASNALGLVRGDDTAFGSPALTLFGAASVTNECPASSTNDPGSSAIGAPLAIAGGGAHSLVLKNDGTVAAWGDNGQTNVPAGLTNVAAIAGGEDCSLALRRSGTLAAWGSNVYGQTNVPAGFTNVVAIASRSYHNMVLKSNGTVAAWGNNSDGQTTVPVGLSNVVAVAAGGFHSLALRREGTVAAWGHDFYGQSTIPAGLSNVVSIAAGYYHSLALKGDGTVVAWGAGLLNDGISPLYAGQSMVPAGLSNVVSIAAGYYHSLALKGDGTVVAWGYNADHETSVPAGLSNVVAIAGGALHNLALKSDGTVVAWGHNGSGQATIPVGLSALAVTVGGTFSTNNTPGVFTRTYSAGNALGGIATATRTIFVQDTTPPVITLLGSNPLIVAPNVPFVDPGATALDACGGSVIVTTNSTVNVDVPGIYSVHYAAADSVGNSATNTRTVVVGVLPIVATLPVTGASNTVATLHGTVIPNGNSTAAWFEWGLYEVNNTNRTAPVAVGGGTNIVAVSNPVSGLNPGSIYHARLVASNAAGLVRAGDMVFGLPVFTLVGAAAVTNECHAAFADPGAFASGSLLAIAAGGFHSLAVKSDRTVAAWGYNGYGQTTVPVGLSNVVAIAAGDFHSLALKGDGTVAAWGNNESGQTSVPAGLSNVVAIAAGYFHSLALRGDGTVVAWGRNDYGQATVPAGLSNVVAIAGGGYHSLALKNDGTVVALGLNSNVPAGLDSVVAISGGFASSFALKSDGTVAGWGNNDFGQITFALGLSNVVAIAWGNFHNLALRSDGTVVAWGYNDYGQTNIPVGLSNVVSIGVGFFHNLALKSDGTVAAWGYNEYGQASVPVGSSGLTVTVGGTFSTNNPPGVYTRSYSASNSLGGISAATRTVVVQDTLPPVITLLGSNPITNRVDVPFIDPGATALDACGGSLVVTTNSTVNVAVLGTYTVSYTATDSSGNGATNTRTVVVTPVPPVVATLPATGVSNTVATLNGTVIPGGFPITVWFEWGGYGLNHTNFTTPLAVGGGTNAVAVSDQLSGLTPGLLYQGRLVASNTLAVVQGNNVLFGTPFLALIGADTVTNECHAAFADPFAATALLQPVAGGGYHSLALKTDGTIAAWGNDVYGQTTTPAGLSNVVALAAGDNHSLALKSDGTIAAWGHNGYGQTTLPAGLSGVMAIEAGGFHSLAVKNDGTVIAWGANEFGQAIVPPGLSNVLAVAGGFSHSLALVGAGTIVGWGLNAYGQATSPAGLSNVLAVAGGGYHSLALKSDGSVVAWGYNGDGQVIIPANLSNVVSIAAGYGHSLALKNDGMVAAWGRNVEGQTTVPAGLSNVVAIAAGGYHSLAVKRDGTVVAWGYNVHGESTIPANLRTLTMNLSVGGTFHTNNLPGTYTRTYSASNLLGGVTTVTRTIVVQDTVSPVITRYGNSPLFTPPNVPFVDPGVIALDSCDSGLTLTTNSTVNVAFDGRYSVTYVATDSSGNGATNTRTVIVGVLPMAVTLPVTGASNTVSTLNGTVVPGSSPVTLWFEWGLHGSNDTNLTAPVVVGSSTNTVAVSNLLSGFTPGLTYRARLVISNALAVAHGLDVLFGTPLLTLNGLDTLTNECHADFADPSATATSAPRAIAAGAAHSLVLKGDGVAAAWGRNSESQTTIPAGLNSVVAIAGGALHSLALRSDGTVAGWGFNNYGQTTIPSGLSNAVAVAKGGYHSLALKSDGTVAAWGYNGDGELAIPTGLSNVVAIAGGGYHNLALKNDGTITAWGRNLEGQSTIPLGLTNIIAIAGGDTHSLALKSDGTVAAWGNNGSGRTTIPAGLSNVVAITAGYYHSLAITSDGMVAAWGDNSFGQTTVPAGLSNVVAIAAGEWHSLALKGDGTVVAWGRNNSGQVTVPPGLSTLAVIVGGNFSPNNAPGVYTRTYGATNSFGGIAATATRIFVVLDTLPPVITLLGANPLTTPLNVPFVDPGATALDLCGGSLAVMTNSTVNGEVLGTYSVSYIATDSFGNSATSTRTVVISPVELVVTTLPVTASNTVAMLRGTISPGLLPITFWFEWWDGASSTNLTSPVTMDASLSTVAVSNLVSGLTPGLIYRGRVVASNAQVVVRGLEVLFGTPLLTLIGAATVTNECHAAFADPGAFSLGAALPIAAGAYHSLAVRSDGTVAAWGAVPNFPGSFPDYGQTAVPSGLRNVVAVAAGSFHSLALKGDGTVAAWGRNSDGQTNIPVGLSNVVAIAGGAFHNFALRTDGTIAAWGYNGLGQTTIPEGLTNVAAIAGGASHSLALKNDGLVVAWGANYFGLTNIPAGLSNVMGISAGAYHNLALRNNGTVVAWGFNAYGQTNVPAGLSNVVAISAGGSNSMALKTDGTVVAWGFNASIPVGLSNVVAIAGGGNHSLALKNDGTVVAWGNNAYGQTNVPAGLSTRAMNVGSAFDTNSSPGTYTITYLSSNSIGGITTATRTIVVQDTLPPVITLLGGNPLIILTNTPFVDPGATALDACGGSSAVTTNNPVNVAVPGIYTVSYIAMDDYGHSSTNTRTVAVIAPPRVISPNRLGNGILQFTFSNQPGAAFTVWASTNLALPISLWSNLGAPAELPAGTFLFTDPQATNHAQRFYRVSSP